MNRINQLFGIEYPIIQAGMVWCSGWKLASTVSNSGGLGLIGSGSMDLELLRHHIRACRRATDKPFGVNVPLIYSQSEEVIDLVIEEKVPIVFTSAGNPGFYTERLKNAGLKVAHVVSSLKFALKAESSGVDAVVGEGFEAGGHNGREETTTLCLIPMLREKLQIPILAAGGIGSGRAMLAAFCLGAEGVQVGSRFAAASESSAHPDFKQLLVTIEEGQTMLSLKKLTPVRMIRNQFFELVERAESSGATEEELKELLGKSRAKKGIFEGNLKEGELEIGQIAAQVKSIQPAAEILTEIWSEFLKEKAELLNLDF